MSSVERLVSGILDSCVNSDEVICTDKFLEDEGVALLAQELESLDKQHLILRGNCIGDRGAKALTSMLKKHDSLLRLELNWNQISCSGVKEIASALKTNIVLTHLDFRNNYIKDEGAQALASVLKLNETLQVLDLRWNQITDDGALAFVDTLKVRKLPLIIYLAGNLLSQRVQSITAEWTRFMSSIETEEHEYQPPQISVNLISELESKKESMEKDSNQLREEFVALQEMFANAQRQLDASAVEVAKLEQLRHRDKFNETQLRDNLNAAKERLVELTEEKQLLVDMWDRERSETVERIRSVIGDKDSQIVLMTSERDALNDKVRRLLEEKMSREEYIDTILQQASYAKTQHENEVQFLKTQLQDQAVTHAGLKTEMQACKENMEFALKSQKAKEEEMDILRITSGGISIFITFVSLKLRRKDPRR